MIATAPKAFRFPTAAVSVRTGNGKFTLWLAFALAIHGGLYCLVRRASTARLAAVEKAAEPEALLVAVIPPPPAEPEPQKTKEPTSPPPSPHKTQKIPSAHRETKSIPRIRNEASDIDSFKDVGTIGSLSANTIGTGGSAFAVAVGDTGVPGSIGARGHASSPTTSIGAGQSDSNDDLSSGKNRPVPYRNLSRKARPRNDYNEGIKAEYPVSLHEAGVTGQVRAVVTIGPDGTVLSVQILDATAPEFAAAAAKVFWRFLFESAVDKNGSSVSSEIHLTYKFTLE